MFNPVALAIIGYVRSKWVYVCRIFICPWKGLYWRKYWMRFFPRSCDFFFFCLLTEHLYKHLHVLFSSAYKSSHNLICLILVWVLSCAQHKYVFVIRSTSFGLQSLHLAVTFLRASPTFSKIAGQLSGRLWGKTLVIIDGSQLLSPCVSSRLGY